MSVITRVHADRIRERDTLIVDEVKGHGAVVVATYPADGLVEVYLHAGPCVLLRPDEVVIVRRREEARP
jgi:hypothetical protein